MFNYGSPSEVKMTKALICTRKQMAYFLQVPYFRRKQYLPFLYISNALLVSAVHLKMKLGDNCNP